jgi:DMSO reductase family type II enzyme heme b subunit
MTVRALQNGREIAFLLEWQDATVNDSTLAVDAFRDSAAIQFQILERQPFYS